MGQAYIDPMASLELSHGEQRPSNSMHPDTYTEQLRRHKAHPIETEAVRSILTASVNSSITEPSSSESGNKSRSSIPSHPTVLCGVVNDTGKVITAPREAVRRSDNDDTAHHVDVSSAISLDGALSVAWTDVGSKTAEEVEALPGQRSALPLQMHAI